MTEKELKKGLRNFYPKVWRPFDKKTYRQEWRGSRFIGVFEQLGRDMKYSYQRVFKGYSDYDLFSIFDWFLAVIRPMLFEFKETRHGSPDFENSISQVMFLDENERDQDIHKNWDAVLDRMIFLFGEANEVSCSRENPYEDEWLKACSDVWERTKNESRDEKTGGVLVHFPGEFSEYKELEDNFTRTEKELWQYRNDCKNEALQLFSKWFYDLWD